MYNTNHTYVNTYIRRNNSIIIVFMYMIIMYSIRTSNIEDSIIYNDGTMRVRGLGLISRTEGIRLRQWRRLDKYIIICTAAVCVYTYIYSVRTKRTREEFFGEEKKTIPSPPRTSRGCMTATGRIKRV